MLNKNKFKVILSSIIILLPMLFGIIMWKNLPNTITTRFGADGVADGFSGKAFAVFGLPLILFVLHFVCLFFTFLDKKQKEQNQKALGMIFWIVPMISLITNGIMYRAAFGKEIDLEIFIPILLGIMFIFIGNYLPKIKQNRTLGIKVSWALNNEENWNKTHRFGGKVWVICGIILLFTAFLPPKAMVTVLTCLIVIGAFLPMLYSYLIYKKDKQAGIEYTATPSGKAEKTALRTSAVILPIIIIVIAVLMFTGNIEVECEDTSFKINASYWTNTEVAYKDINSVVYRNDIDKGVRTNGLGSARLSLGIFENDEFGSYTLYSYTGAKEFVVLTSDGKTLVIGLKNSEDTKAIYDTLLNKVADK